MSLQIKKSPVGGLGLFATRNFKRGEFIVEYFGELLTDKQCEERKENRYMFEMAKNRTIDGSTRTNIARYINHSCKNNVEAKGYRRLWIHASRNIKAGEELFLDYGDEYIKDYIKVCKCPKHANSKNS